MDDSSQRADAPRPGGRVYRKDYRPPAFLVDQVDLHFELGEAQTRVHARLAVRRNPSAATRETCLRLDGEELELIALAVNEMPLPDSAFHTDAFGLTVPDVPDQFILDSEVMIRPDRNTDLMGLYAAGGVLCTQCEPEAFRRITYFPDRPDVMARFRTTLTGDPERFPVMLANGNPVARRNLADGRQQMVWDDPHPKPGYLFALVAGRLECVEDCFTTMTGRSVDIHFYVEPGQHGRAGHAVRSIKRAMAWDESRYGREYDLDVFNAVAICQYTMGAMENKGLNIFNDRYVLADPESATDRDYRDIDALVAHEYFHNWSGNRVTCRDWFQLALKEGFTVFREQQYVADHGWAALRRIEDVRLMRERQFAEDAGPLAHPVRPDSYREIENFYTDTVYSKGAEVVRMLFVMLGEQCFRRATDLYFTRHDGQAATVEDFLQCMQDAAGRDLELFARWYDSAGTPRLSVTGQYDATEETYELQVEQQSLSDQSHESALHIPLAIGLLDESGRELPLQLEGNDGKALDSSVLELRRQRERFRFVGIGRRPIPALLRGFSAPVDVRFDYAPGELEVLAVHDRDCVVRWDAIQRLIAKCVIDRERAAEDALNHVFAHILDRGSEEAGLSALLLELPDVIALADGVDEPDLEAIHRQRAALKRHLAAKLGDRFEAVYRQCGNRGAYRPDPADIGRRSLRNVCLGYLAAPDDRAAMDRCLEYYHDARNMTDALAGLELLAAGQGPQRDEALADFRRRWHDDPLVMDKWFSVQARSSRPDTLERVHALMDDPLFSIHQPNRVRSLIEAFCVGNPVVFNRSDGGGYRLLADCVLRIDPGNPPLAAGLLRHLVNRRGCNRHLYSLRLAELERVHQTPGLSRQAGEIVSSVLR